ncbi:hypothetical protein CGSSp18BS74_01481, partial [Streptococcus pneumoniae SP18-BS74]
AKGGRKPKISLEDLLMATLHMCENIELMNKLRLILVFTKATLSVGANGLK